MKKTNKKTRTYITTFTYSLETDAEDEAEAEDIAIEEYNRVLNHKMIITTEEKE